MSLFKVILGRNQKRCASYKERCVVTTASLISLQNNSDDDGKHVESRPIIVMTERRSWPFYRTNIRLMNGKMLANEDAVVWSPFSRKRSQAFLKCCRKCNINLELPDGRWPAPIEINANSIKAVLKIVAGIFRKDGEYIECRRVTV